MGRSGQHLILDTQLVIARDNRRGDGEKRPERSAGEMKPRCQAAPHPQAASPGGPARQAAPYPVKRVSVALVG